MKAIIWSYPVSAAIIQVYEDLNQENPIYETSVGFDKIISAIYQLPYLPNIDEIIVAGPLSYAGHVAQKIQDNFSNIKVSLGEQ